MNEKLLKEICAEVEREWQTGGLSDGIYYRFLVEVLNRYLLTINGR